MPHIDLPEGVPGIRGPMLYRPDTAQHMNELVSVLLHDEHTLSAGEREMIGAAVSRANECVYCSTIHASIAVHQLHAVEGARDLVESVLRDPLHAPVSDKLNALLVLALQVRKGGKEVTPEAVAHARSVGATDLEIHDAILIGASFCMFNRYVDGLATYTPDDPAVYDELGARRAAQGYRVGIT
ncbi:MAG: peroxidase-related enzyme [Bacteroidetes bacterium]|nr:peroxidase-related enzyme [Bacteroidota bacterium]